MKLLLQMLAVVALTMLVTVGVLRYLDDEAPAGTGGVDVVPGEDDELAAALALVEQRGCVACHSTNGNPGLGPSWRGAWGAVREFTDGTSAVFDAAYLRESVADPGARVVEGFQNIMLPAELDETELRRLEMLMRELGRAEVF